MQFSQSKAARWHRKHGKAIRQSLRAEAIAKLGACCCKCGFADERALQFDHVNGGGKSELKRCGGSPAYYRKIIANASGLYQLLCANCNWIKRHENRETEGFSRRISEAMQRYWRDVKAGKRVGPRRIKLCHTKK